MTETPGNDVPEGHIRVRTGPTWQLMRQVGRWFAKNSAFRKARP